jgi:UrcA family protein
MFTTDTNSVSRSIIGGIGTILAAGLCIAGAAGPAPATEAPAYVNTARVQTVSSADLNLANPAGRAALDQRIKAAAESVCSTGLNDTAAKTAESRCVKGAIAAATPVTQG